MNKKFQLNIEEEMLEMLINTYGNELENMIIKTIKEHLLADMTNEQKFIANFKFKLAEEIDKFTIDTKKVSVNVIESAYIFKELPYSPLIKISIYINTNNIFITIKSEVSSPAFRNRLRNALDILTRESEYELVCKKYNLSKKYASVLNVEMKICGLESHLDADIKKTSDSLKEIIEAIYSALCKEYGKKYENLF